LERKIAVESKPVAAINKEEHREQETGAVRGSLIARRKRGRGTLRVTRKKEQGKIPATTGTAIDKKTGVGAETL